MSQSAVSRIWRAFGLAPHKQDSSKLSADPMFVDKVRDVARLYLNPQPERALVLCVDETQIQALNRTAPHLASARLEHASGAESTARASQDDVIAPRGIHPGGDDCGRTGATVWSAHQDRAGGSRRRGHVVVGQKLDTVPHRHSNIAVHRVVRGRRWKPQHAAQGAVTQPQQPTTGRRRGVGPRWRRCQSLPPIPSGRLCSP
jgi:hypothetical protein